MNSKEYFITSYLPATDTVIWDKLKDLSDEEIRVVLHKLGGTYEFWVCVHDNPRDSNVTMEHLNVVADCHFGGSFRKAVEAFRYGLQDDDMDLGDKIMSLLSLSSLADREVSLDQYISVLDIYRRNFLASMIAGTNNYAQMSRTGLSPPDSG